MTRKRILLIGISIASVAVGLLLAYLTRGTTVSNQPFMTMATVQGAFVGIVFSIFVLASQVSASQFTPLTLEQLSRSRGFAALLVFYVLAILTNIYLIQVHTLPFSVSYIPQSWNSSMGVGAGLMTASLLSLLVARQLLADLTTPEHLLERTAKSVSRDAFTETTVQNSKPSPPTRTSLFTIERILVAAHKEEDEYTTQQAIYQLWKATDQLLSPSVVIGAGYRRPDPSTYTNELDLKKLLSYWETAAEYGTKGPIDRIRRTANAQRHILIALIEADEIPEAIEQFDNLHKLSIESIKKGNDLSILIEYKELAPEIAANDSSAPLNEVVGHHAKFVRNRVNFLKHESDNDTIETTSTLLAAVICNYVMLLESVWESGLSVSACQSRTNSIISQLSEDLSRIFDVFDTLPSPIPLKQTLLTELQRSIIDAVSAIDTEAAQPVDRYIVMIVELSLALDRASSTVSDSLCENLDGQNDKKEFFVSRLNNWSIKDSYQPEFRELSIEESDVEEFVDSIYDEMSQA